MHRYMGVFVRISINVKLIGMHVCDTRINIKGTQCPLCCWFTKIHLFIGKLHSDCTLKRWYSFPQGQDLTEKFLNKLELLKL